MNTRSVELTEHQAQVIDGLVQSGRYPSADDAVNEGVRLVEQREAQDAAKLEALREAAAVGIRELERGEFIEFSDAEALAAHLRAVANKATSGR
jgi:antitoxin ParD1/3/4